ncbi:hypothetical protein MVES1_003772 [Malassezia vespertilionis]|uniref:Lysosomal dipeptide transporter MFSD1 n=1 Tax=Malassezia vespertilionis TaxID=2020962 RepID=A0A2N1J8P3_9BASI|nr:uncharacterized protein MVES1_003772 [Malassezia vespertilionis]PKI82931.1 hypothetical protein MVES_003331 [Malassezia vespertilionis]WFD08400.1 hypothetical protein MVES1_003772 [Malassezia vespertilionis]
MSPLKSTLKNNLKENGEQICNARYGVISSAGALINVIYPFISGILIDFYGPSLVCMLCSIFALVGNIVLAVGAQRDSFTVVLGGQIIAGFGLITLNSCKYRLYAHWFSGSVKSGPGHMALVIGLDIGVNRIYNTIGKQSAVPIMNDAGQANWYWAFWFGAILCAFSFVVNIAYLILEFKLPASLRVKTGYMLARAEARKSGLLTKHKSGYVVMKEQLRQIWRSLYNLPAAYWLICCTQILQSGTIDAYASNSPELIQVTRGVSTEVAAYQGGLDQVIPIVLSPVFGFLIDQFGKRHYLISYTAAIYILAYALLAYTWNVSALAPVLLSSLALSSNDIPFEATIPLIVSSKTSLGAAYGGWAAFYSSGTVIMDVSTGAIQNHSLGVKHVDPKHQYDDMFYFLIAIKCVGVLNGFLYLYLDKRYLGNVMGLSERARIAKEAKEQKEKRIAGRKDDKLLVHRGSWTIAGVFMYLALAITSYVIFIYYSVAKERCR